MLNLGAGTNLGSAYGEVKIGTEDAQRSLKTLADAADSMNRMTFTVGDAIRNSIEFGVKAAVTSLAVVTGALVATAAKGLESFASLEKGMNEVFTLLPGISEEAMDKMTDDLQKFNNEMGVTSGESVPALYQAISAGVPAENVFSFLETAQKAAIGGVSDLETAVDGLTSVVNAYGAEVIDHTKASDIMFTAVRLGKTTVDELAGSFFNVVPVAAGLGVNFEDVAAALAAMTAQGTPTSVATTQLRQLLVELSTAGTDVSDAFVEMTGKTFQEFIAEGNNLQDALMVIAGGFTTTGDESEKAAEKTRKIRDKISDLKGQLDLAIVRQGEFNENTSASTRLANENKISKLTRDIADYEDELSNINTTSSTTHTKMTDLFGSVEAGNAALALTGRGTETFTRNLGEMDNAAGATEKAYEQMDQGISRSIEKIRAALGTMMEQVGEKLEPMFADLLAWVQENMPDFSDMVVGVFSEIADFAKENLPSALDSLQSGFDTLKENLIPFVRDVLEKVQNGFTYIKDEIIPLVKEALPDIKQAFANFAESVIPFIGDYFPKMIEGLKSIWDASEPLREMIGKLVEKFGDLDSKQVELIAKAAAVVLAIGPVVSAISGLVSIFTGAMGLVSAIGTVIGWITGSSGIVAALGAVLNPVGLVVAAVAGLLLAWNKDFLGIKTTTTEALRDIGQWFREKPGEWIKAIREKISEWVDAGRDLINGIIKGIQDRVSAAWKSITDFAGGIIDRVRNIFGIRSPSAVFAEIGEYMMEGLEGGLRAGSSSVSSFMDGFTSDLLSTASQTTKQFEDLLTSAYDAVGGGGPVTQGATALDLTGALSEQAALIKQRINEVKANLSPNEKVEYGKLLLEGAQKLASAAIEDGSKTVLDQASNAIRSIIESGIASELKFTMEDGMPSSVAFTNRLWELFRQIQIGGNGQGGNYIGQDAANALGGNVVGGNSNFLGAAMEALLGGYGANLTAMLDNISGGAISGNGGAGTTVTNNYNFQLAYETQQSSGAVGQDVALLNALYGGTP